MPDESYAKKQAPDTPNTGGADTPIEPAARKTIDKMSGDGRSTAKPESQPGSGFVVANDGPTQSEEQYSEE